MDIMNALLANQAMNARGVTAASASYIEDVRDLVLRTGAAVVIAAVVLAFLALA
jgi:hypothetical protein